MPVVTVRGVRFQVDDQGQGQRQTIVVAHGLFGSIAESQRSGFPTAQLMGAGYRVVQYDARGHGSSEGGRHASEFHWRELATDLDGLMDALGIGNATILGTSMGAGTALVFSLMRPERVRALILRHPPPFGRDLLPVRLRMAGLAACLTFLGPKNAAALISSGNPSFRRVLAAQQPHMALPAVRGLLFSQPQLRDEPLHLISAPTLILVHPGDMDHPVRSAEFLSQRLQRVVVQRAPRRGYWKGDGSALCSEVLAFIHNLAC